MVTRRKKYHIAERRRRTGNLLSRLHWLCLLEVGAKISTFGKWAICGAVMQGSWQHPLQAPLASALFSFICHYYSQYENQQLKQEAEIKQFWSRLRNVACCCFFFFFWRKGSADILESKSSAGWSAVMAMLWFQNHGKNRRGWRGSLFFFYFKSVVESTWYTGIGRMTTRKSPKLPYNH